MARATTWAGVGIIAGMALGGATAEAALPPTAGLAMLAGQAAPRSARVYNALSSGTDCYRRGDYERAAVFFQEAQAGQDLLSTASRTELTKYVALNNQALTARRAGADQLRRADEALRAGKVVDAETLLRSLTANQFLSAADKQKMQQLQEKMRPRSATAATPATGVPPIVLARAKLQQARALLAKGDFTVAAALARDAEQLKAVYNMGEDTPLKVQADIAKYREDPTWLTKTARAALNRGEIDRAEELAHLGQHASSLLAGFRFWGDSPRKVLRDAQQARRLANKLPPAKAPATIKEQPVLKEQNAVGKPAPFPSGLSPKGIPADAPAKAQGDGNQSRKPGAGKDAGVQQVAAKKPADETPQQKAHKLLAQARMALQQNNVAQAKQYVAQAKALKVEYKWWEDTPDKVNADIQRAIPRLSDLQASKQSAVSGQQSAAKPAAAQGKTGTTTAKAPSKPTAADAATMVRDAREQLNAKKLDDAEKLACQAKAARPNGWGLFDDSPDKVLQDVRKARAKHNREESVQLMVEARKLFVQGKYADARAKAYRAERLHGPYSIWDLGDRPQKLLAEIDSAEAKAHRIKVPPMPGAPERPAETAMANATRPAPKPPVQAPAVRPEMKTAVASAVTPPRLQTVTPPAPVWPKEAPAAPAPQWPKQTNGAPAPSPYAMTAPAVAAPMLAAPVAATAVAANTRPNPMPAPYVPQAPAVDPVKQQAQRLVAEARQLQARGQLLAARQKAIDAQRLRANFASDEDRPERVLIALAGQANGRIYNLMQSATDLAATAGTDANRYRQAEDSLNQARQLAAGFALDTQPLDAKLAWVRQTRDRAVMLAQRPAPSPVVPVQYQQPPAVAAVNPMQRQGLDLLDKARLELRNGNTTTARRLGEEAYKEAYGVRSQAEAVLRSVDTEEFNQRRLVANRTYEIGYAAFQRREYVQAAAMLRSVDMSLLDTDKAARYREIMRTPEVQTLMPASAQVAAASPAGGSDQPGRAVASDQPAPQPINPEATFAQRVGAMQEVQFQKLRGESLQAQRNAIERYRAGDPDRAIEILQQYLDGLGNTGLDAGKVALLRKPVETRLEHFKMMKVRDDLVKLQEDRHQTMDGIRRDHALAEQMKQEKVGDLMKQYHALYKDGKYQEAEMVAMKAHELDPDNVAADAAVNIARIHNNIVTHQKLKEGKEAMVLNVLNSTDDEGPVVDMKNPLKFDPAEWERVKKNRIDYSKGIEIRGFKTEKDLEIERGLSRLVSFEYKNRSLREVIDDLGSMTGINIIADMAALNEEGVSLDQKLDLKLEQVSLRSALKLLLEQLHLTYIIRDEALKVTTARMAKGKLQQKTYSVADLVIPVENFTGSPCEHIENIFDQHMMRSAGAGTFYNNVTPYTGLNTMPYGQPTGTPGGFPGAQRMTSTSSGNAQSLTSAPQPAGLQSQTIENTLIATIKNTVAPQSWSDMGGPGTIDYFPLGMALVINQTPDIQEQVAELLAALRRLQDIEVAIEVRFITISESFYERIGVSFDLNVVNRDTAKYEPQITSGQFAPSGFVNRFIPQSFISGMTPAGIGGVGAGTFTHDLNIPITATSFGPATPPFGAFPIAPGADGGLSLGLAFLSDIQVYMFMEAAQGDRRTNVMQAPKLTMYNGQTAALTVLDFQYFVTGNIIGLINGQVVVSPQNTPFPIGTTLTMVPVVSADRRFVRITMAPNLTNLTTPVAALFPITTIVQTTFDINLPGPPVPIVQFIQQPQINRVSATTTVNVPDGGTVLMGGLKILREGRNEFGPPILSKIPYLSRLYKNTGYGRDADSLMIMVTPRIIINEEEETHQTGFIAPPSGGGGL